MAGLPPAVSISLPDLAREAGVPLSGNDWGNLNDGKQFSKFLLVFRLQNGRGKVERRDSRREERNAPARSRGRQAEGFAREPTVVCPAPSGLFVPLTVGARGAPAPGDMPVRFKVRPGSPGPKAVGGSRGEAGAGRGGPPRRSCAAPLGPAEPVCPPNLPATVLLSWLSPLTLTSELPCRRVRWY